MFLLDRGGDFFSVADGDVEADVFLDLFLGSAGECMNVSVVGVKRAAGGGGGLVMDGMDAGAGSGAATGTDLGADVGAGDAEDVLDASRNRGAPGLDARELVAEFVRHLSFHLLSVFLTPMLSLVPLVVCEAVSTLDMSFSARIMLESTSALAENVDLLQVRCNR